MGVSTVNFERSQERKKTYFVTIKNPKTPTIYKWEAKRINGRLILNCTTENLGY